MGGELNFQEINGFLQAGSNPTEGISTSPTPEEKNNNETPEDFKQKSIELLTLLEAEKKGNNRIGEIFTYGNFTEKTSTNENILVKTVGWPSKGGLWAENNIKNVILLGLDPETKKIVGLRVQRLDFGNDELDGSCTATGEITTRKRGVGITSALDRAMLKVLQMEITMQKKVAPLYPIKVTWQVENGNRRILEKYKEMKSEGAEIPLLDKLIKDKEDEQRRWLKHYEKDELGFQQTPDEFCYKKTILPIPRYINSKVEKMDMSEYEKIIGEVRECTQ